MIRVLLPYHLRALANISDEVLLEMAPPITIRSILDSLEARFPALSGTIRDRITLQRRPFIRFYACKEDISNVHQDTIIAEAVATGDEPFLIVGAIAGG